MATIDIDIIERPLGRFDNRSDDDRSRASTSWMDGRDLDFHWPGSQCSEWVSFMEGRALSSLMDLLQNLNPNRSEMFQRGLSGRVQIYHEASLDMYPAGVLYVKWPTGRLLKHFRRCSLYCSRLMTWFTECLCALKHVNVVVVRAQKVATKRFSS